MGRKRESSAPARLRDRNLILLDSRCRSSTGWRPTQNARGGPRLRGRGTSRIQGTERTDRRDPRRRRGTTLKSEHPDGRSIPARSRTGTRLSFRDRLARRMPSSRW